MSKEKLSIITTLFGEDLMKMFMAGPLKDDSGIVFGVANKALGDNHLTLTIKEDQLQSHRTKTIDGIKEREYNEPITFQEISDKLDQIVGKWERKVHGNRKVFVVKQRIQLDAILMMGNSKINSIGNNRYNIRHEESDSVVTLDMNDEKAWEVTRASKLSTFKGTTAFTILDDEFRFIHCTSKPGIFQCPLFQEIQEFAQVINQMIGLDDYLEDVLEMEEIKGPLEEKIAQISKEKNLQDDPD